MPTEALRYDGQIHGFILMGKVIDLTHAYDSDFPTFDANEPLLARVLATDQSPAMVEATKERGVRAEVADADHLPYADGSFDAVVAMWMLYHVPDLDRTLADVRRVLRPGGVLVAATNGRQHTADLRAAVGLGPAITQFMAEDGADLLSRHFDEVESMLTSGRAVADHATATAYLSTFAPDLAGRLAPYDGTRTYTGSGAVFVARRR